MMICYDMDALVGATPLLALPRLTDNANLLAKLECRNPAGSVKDRAALAMLDAAQADGRLPAGGTIIEPTSGNTGIALCAAAARRGYRAIMVMPDTMSPERRKLMTAYGAEVVLTPGALGMAGAIAKAKELAADLPNAWIADQFSNPDNALAHYQTTGPEIWADTAGRIDAFVACVGTGGTLSGTARYLKEQDPSVHIVAVEPAESAVLSGAPSGPHGIQGIGAGFVPAVLDTALIDEVLPVETAAAKDMARRMGKTYGLLVGISSGAALTAALQVAQRPEFAGKTVVTLLPDSGERYLSTDLYEA